MARMFLLVPQVGRQREAIAPDLRAGAAGEADHDVWVDAKAKVQTLPGGWSWLGVDSTPKVDDRVEGAVGERKRFGVSLPEFDREAIG